ncbi:6-bladed beta-propeller [Thermodesulfobacteriota bacterium]
MKSSHNFKKYTSVFLCCFSIFIVLTATAFSEDTFVFERMWPTLQQPWYFWPTDVAVDNDGYVYVAGSGNARVTKLNSDGQLITEWGPAYNPYWRPMSLDIDPAGNVYVVDISESAIDKFTSDGQFISRWGGPGSGDGKFDFNDDENHIFGGGIAIDSSGWIYVADTMNHRIQKFDPDGQFIMEWGSLGTDNGLFDCPAAIAVDADGNVYVVDAYNSRVQKFTSNGEFITKWGSYGYDEDQFAFQSDHGLEGAAITIDPNGHVHVVDGGGPYERVQKFTSEGEFIARWGSGGYGEDPVADGEFNLVRGIASDKYGNIYIADQEYNRVQKFTINGQFITKWGSSGVRNGEFNHPVGIDLDSYGNVMVLDTYNKRLQKFTPNGQFITQVTLESLEPYGVALDGSGNIYVTNSLYNQYYMLKLNPEGEIIGQWGSSGSGDGQFNFAHTPTDIAVDADGNIYVVDIDNNRIQKFDSNGEFITKFGSYGFGPGQFDFFWHDGAGIAIDKNAGWVYVTDEGNDCIHKFDLNGNFLLDWNMYGDEDWEVLVNPRAIAVDSIGHVYVMDSSCVIWEFTSAGEFVGQHAEEGTGPGQISHPHDLVISPNGKIYVADSSNNRVQVFNKSGSSLNNRAIIVAGGGSYPGNNLWNATQMSANFAYRTLTYQGFTKESIYYLSSDTDLDLDGNGELDDVDAGATNANLEYAITSWATETEDLLVYLIDHGGDGTFRMSGTETLSATELDAWLDQVQETITGNVIVIYDACESGSFMSQLIPPSEKERIVIGSTSPGESAYFVTQGSISFSSFFWTHIFNGLSIKEAFDLASQSITDAVDKQHPMLNDNGNGIGNEEDDGDLSQNTYLGNGTVISGDAPVIGSVTPETVIPDTNSALLYAEEVTDADDIARVWAVIRPPNYTQGSAYNPVYGLPSIDLMAAGDNRWEATYSNFDIPGTYYIAIYARDSIGNTSIPSITTISVNDPLAKKTLIIAAGNEDDPLWPVVRGNAYQAYNVLKFQGYTEDNIYLMSNNAVSDATVDGPASISNIESVLSGWAITGTQDFVVYMTGKANKRQYWINETEKILPDELDALLDTAQSSIPGMLTVIYDGDYSGSFIPDLSPPVDKKRIVIASAKSDQKVNFITDGDLSFSRFFWGRVLNGANVRDSFIYARTAMSYLADQTGMLDDNGNGIGNEKTDGLEAREYSIGTGIMLAGDNPIIGEVCPDQIIGEGGTADIWARDITTTGTIERVWAVITPPAGEIATVQFTNDGTGTYEGAFNGFYYYGEYSVVFYTEDLEGNISFPANAMINYTSGPDIFEDNDSLETAGIITVDDVKTHFRNFHDAGDEDWVKFYGIEGETYEIETVNPESLCDTQIRLYDDKSNLLEEVDIRYDGDEGVGELISWLCPKDGIYYIQVKQAYSSDYGAETGYDLIIYRPLGGTPGTLSGIVINALGEGLGGAIIRSDSTNTTDITHNDGTYELVLPSGTYIITVDIPDYFSQSEEGIVIESEGYVSHDFILISSIDSDNDGTPDNEDGCPYDTNKTALGECGCGIADTDSDDDGIADCNDDYPNDYDNDGMPDDWEDQNGLDPEVNDADEDPDEDGFSNIQEYNRETDPQDAQSYPSRAMPWLPLLLGD